MELWSKQISASATEGRIIAAEEGFIRVNGASSLYHAFLCGIQTKERIRGSFVQLRVRWLGREEFTLSQESSNI